MRQSLRFVAFVFLFNATVVTSVKSWGHPPVLHIVLLLTTTPAKKLPNPPFISTAKKRILDYSYTSIYRRVQSRNPVRFSTNNPPLQAPPPPHTHCFRPSYTRYVPRD